MRFQVKRVSMRFREAREVRGGPHVGYSFRIHSATTFRIQSTDFEYPLNLFSVFMPIMPKGKQCQMITALTKGDFSWPFSLPRLLIQSWRRQRQLERRKKNEKDN